MSNAILGYFTKFSIHSEASPPTYVELVEVTEVVFPNIQADDVDVTHMQSPAKTREYIAGFKEPGECSVTCNWIDDNTTDARLIELHTSGATRSMRITTPRGMTYTFNGYVKGIERTSPIDDRRTITATMKVAGAVTVVVNSPLDAVP